mmetsp:Transcript_26978/g.42140  ORF Transcript_26978/g.42140 Transcript_26978/m.42140 type:complete len:108 (+) Transcript_26978:894-1217(+)
MAKRAMALLNIPGDLDPLRCTKLITEIAGWVHLETKGHMYCRMGVYCIGYKVVTSYPIQDAVDWYNDTVRAVEARTCSAFAMRFVPWPVPSDGDGARSRRTYILHPL